MLGAIRRRVSAAVGEGLYRSGALHLAGHLIGRGRAVVLRYHSVGDGEGPPPAYLEPSLCVDLGAFVEQMRLLRERYRPVSMDEVVDAVEGRRELPAGAVAVTFDDGYRDNYTNALPVLRQYGIPATFYVTAGCIDSGEALWTCRLRYAFVASPRRAVRFPGAPGGMLDLGSPEARSAAFARAVAVVKSAGANEGETLLRELEAELEVSDYGALRGAMVSWDELRVMAAAGMTIGAHTLTHPNLPGLPVERAEMEIAGSKALIECRLGVRVRHFAYPNGRGRSHVNGRVRELVRAAGFRSATTSIEGPVRPGDDPFALRRVGVYRRHAVMSRLVLGIERARLAGAGRQDRWRREARGGGAGVSPSFSR